MDSDLVVRHTQLVEATREYQSVVDEIVAFDDDVRTRRAELQDKRSHALSRLNAAQGQFDAIVATIKASAPTNSDWKDGGA